MCANKCINRKLNTECSGDTCPCKQFCQNRKFQRHQDAFVYPFMTRGKGFGLKAGEAIPKGSFVMQYVGEVYSVDCPTGQKRLIKNEGSTCTYLMQIDNNYVVDPTKSGNMARFANHSCDPNCEIIKWNVNGEICVGIFSVKDILENEEITFKYNFDMYSTALSKCRCGSTNCQGYLGVRPKDIDPDKWDEQLKSLECEICHATQETKNNEMLLCDNCNKGFHIKCLHIEKVPQDDWLCLNCSKNTNAKEKKAQVEDETPIKIEEIRQIMNNVLKELESICEREKEFTAAYNFMYELQLRIYGIVHPQKPTKLKADIGSTSEIYLNFKGIVDKAKSIPPTLDTDFKCKLLKLSFDKYEEFAHYLKLIKQLLIEISVSCYSIGVNLEFYGNHLI